MAQASYLISIAPDGVEGGRVPRGSSQADDTLSVYAPSGEAPDAEHMAATFETFCQAMAGRRLVATVVLPTSVVSLRRMEFPFTDHKQIGQVLPFELEAELIDEPLRFQYDFEVRNGQGNRSEALVYLVEREMVDALAETAERHQVYLHRITFSAHALAASAGGGEERRLLVYVGADEAYVAEARAGRLIEVTLLNAQPGRVLAEQGSTHQEGPKEILAALIGAGTGEEAPETQTARQGLENVLTAARDEINRSLRVLGGGEAPRVSLHGLFAPLFTTDSGGGEVSLRLEAELPAPISKRPLFGVLPDLIREGGASPAKARGINFIKRVSTWRLLISDLKWPAAVAGILLALTLLLVGGGFFLRASALQQRLAVVNTQLGQTLKIQGPINSFVVRSALSRLEEQTRDLKKERESTAFLERYHYDILRLLDDLSALHLKQTGWIVQSLSYNRNRFAITGTVESYVVSEEIKNQVAGLSRFQGQQVKISHSRTADGISYRITVER